MYQSQQHDFMANSDLLTQIVAQLADEEKNAAHEPILLIGPCGSGKTYLLQQLYRRITSDRHLVRQWLPITFMAQSYEILCLADFYLECLFHLNTALKSDLNPEINSNKNNCLVALVNKVYQQLASCDNDITIVEQCQQTLTQVISQSGKKLLLCLENVHELVKQAEPSFLPQWQAWLQSQTHIVLLATANKDWTMKSPNESCFWQWCQKIQLPPLTTEQCQVLWQSIAPMHPDVAIRPIQILAADNPQAFISIAKAAAQQPMFNLNDAVDTLVTRYADSLTGLINNIAPKERKVYLALVDLWQPSTTKQITERARMDMRAVSALLGRLVSKALISEISPNQGGKGKRYFVSDNFCSLYYKLNRECRADNSVCQLVDFMTAFYRQTDLLAIQRARTQSQPQTLIDLWSQVVWQAEPLAQQLLALINMDQLTLALGEKVDSFDWLTQFIGPLDDALNEKDYDALGQHCEVLLQTPVVNQFIIIQCMALDLKALSLAGNGQLMAAVNCYQSMIDGFAAQNDIMVKVLITQAMLNMGLCYEYQQQYETASACYSDAITQTTLGNHRLLSKLKARALYCKGNSYRQLDKPASAVNSFARLTNDFGDSDFGNNDSIDNGINAEVAASYLQQGLIWLQLKQTGHARKSLTRLIDTMQHSPLPSVQQSVSQALLVLSHIAIEAKQNDSALHYLDQLIGLCAEHSTGRQQLAEDLATAWLHRGMLLYRQGKTQEAMTSLHGLFETSSDNPKPSAAALALVTYLAADQQKIPQILAIFTANPKLWASCHAMVLALQLELGQTVYASARHRAVADDICRQIAQLRAEQQQV